MLLGEQINVYLLILEDNPDDAELEVRELEREGFDVKWIRVDTEEGFKEALAEKPDLILIDYSIPSFGGLAALKVYRQLDLEIPLIIVSGTIGEEVAVECMKLGATDYVLKDNFSRLGPVTKRALEEMKTYRKSKQIEATLLENETKYRLLADNTVDFIWQMNSDLEFTYINQVIFPFFGYTTEEWIGSKLSEHCSLKEMEKIGTLMTAAFANLPDLAPVMFETFFYRKDGKEIPCEVNSKLVLDDAGNPLYFQGITRDITERKLAEKEKKKLETTISNVQKGAISALITTVEYRDPYTAGHQQRVSDIASAIAKNMGFPEDKIVGIRMAGMLHDIGKITIPTEILNKSGQLNKMEFAFIKGHSQVGHDILNSIKFPWPLSQIVLQHHERIDGSGYPDGLLGKEILIDSKILAVADVVEAMFSHRPYRPSLGIDKALEEISINKGKLYDVDVVEACLKLFKDKEFQFDK